MSDYGDMCRELRDSKRETRMKFGVDCPKCREKRPKACPSILLPQQRCKVDGYRDPRPRTPEADYFARAGYHQEKP